MSATMTTLSVPVPVLQFEGAGGDVAVLEKPVTIASKAVFLPDGRVITDQIVGGVAGYFLYRQASAAGPSQVWDPELKTWRTAGDGVVTTLKPKPLAFKKDDPLPWQGLFVAATEKGAVQRGSMSYYFRTIFSVPFGVSTLTALSAPAKSIRFVAALDVMQAGLKIENPETATEVTVFLRNSAKQLIGSVHLLNDGGQARIEISNTAGASVRLTRDGDIELDPAIGRSVIINGSFQHN